MTQKLPMALCMLKHINPYGYANMKIQVGQTEQSNAWRRAAPAFHVRTREALQAQQRPEDAMDLELCGEEEPACAPNQRRMGPRGGDLCGLNHCVQCRGVLDGVCRSRVGRAGRAGLGLDRAGGLHAGFLGPPGCRGRVRLVAARFRLVRSPRPQAGCWGRYGAEAGRSHVVVGLLALALAGACPALPACHCCRAISRLSVQ